MSKVAILMGSKSDWEIMKEAKTILEELGIQTEARVLSAHRTPDETVDFVKKASENGFDVIIAGAGGAAHLAGVCAANTLLPVIGVPIPSKHLQGVDSLYSTVQMPPGVPVATVGIGAAQNAGLLAARIIASHDQKVAKKLAHYVALQRKMVLESKLE